ncbi:MAG TPA: SusC/RagA family TonB-linked outer membrane protein, partial [Candidatus Prevotella intestinigallinarum]|nr:SusC/RagA family TonB-linked outer membrane protein [Candidatus Prevotella intestinigallinarum]
MKQVSIRCPFRFAALLVSIFLSVGAFAQITVKGHVNDDTGESVIGATVRVEGAQGGTVTDYEGNFTIKAREGANINITYVGYQPATVKAAPSVLVVLKSDAQVLDNVVVIGYGTVKKSDLTGSVTALKPDSKNKGLVVNAQDMIQGKVAGVNVISNDGTPGGGAQIRIRGGSSLNASNDPLIVIDGMAMDNDGVKGLSNKLSMINPQDIESFNVLKDASATAIYGSRGSNGVIIITTKKGRKGQKPTVSYSGSMTISTKKKTVDVLDADGYRSLIEDIYGVDSEAYSALGTANTDWQDLIYRTAWSHDHNVTLSGALKNLPYRVSVGYTNQEGILKTSDFERVTASINLNPSLLDDHLTMNLNAKGMYARTQYADGGAVAAAVKMDPTQDPYRFTSKYHQDLLYDSTNDISLVPYTLKNFGGYFEWTTTASYGDSSWKNTYNSTAEIPNPMALLYEREDIAHSRAFVGSADIDYKVHGFEDLRLHLTLGADISKGRQSLASSPACPRTMYYGSYGAEEILKRNLSLSAYVQYYKDFNEKHHFDVMAGYEWQHFWKSTSNDYVGYYRMTNDDLTLRGTARPHTCLLYTSDAAD